MEDYPYTVSFLPLPDDELTDTVSGGVAAVDTDTDAGDDGAAMMHGTFNRVCPS